MNKFYKTIIGIFVFILLVTTAYGAYSYKTRVVDDTDYSTLFEDDEEFVYQPEIDYIYVEERIEFSPGVEQHLAEMSVTDKINMMIMMDYDRALDSGVVGVDDGGLDVMNTGIGAIVYHRNNIESQTQIRNMISNLDYDYRLYFVTEPLNILSSTQDDYYPVNEILELTDLVTPSQMGRSYEASDVSANILQRSEELKYLGFNAIQAPFCNVDNSAVSFGTNPVYDTEYVESAITTYSQNAVVNIATTFPYRTFREVSFDDLAANDLMVFQQAIDSNVPMIAVSTDPCFAITGSRTLPTVMSKKTIDLLRARMGFNGVVVTDSLKDINLKEDVTNEALLIETVNSGIDMIYNPANYNDALIILSEAVERGDIAVNRIDNAVGRILTVKENLIP